MSKARLSVQDIKESLARDHRCDPSSVSIVMETGQGQRPELYAVVPWYWDLGEQRRIAEPVVTDVDSSNPPCVECGAITSLAGSCFLCSNCGATSGCS